MHARKSGEQAQFHLVAGTLGTSSTSFDFTGSLLSISCDI
jgi:hypothetical protein